MSRDANVLLSKDYGRTFQFAAVDPWRIGVCVMSTASIAAIVDRAGGFKVVY